MYLQDRMKRRWEITMVLVGILLIGLLIFIKLYVDETQETQRQYSTVFTKNVTDAHDILKDYTFETFDAKTKYTNATTELGTAREMIFLMNSASDEERNTMNELYHALVKYPAQMLDRCPEVAQALEEITGGDKQKGYETIDTIIGQLDLLDTDNDPFE